jgi:hypothetical protein
MPGNSSIDSFRGDFRALSAMMEQSWAQNANRALVYSEDFLRSAFAYPGSSYDLAPSVYRAAELLAFVAGFPRSVCLGGREMRLILTSFLTASPVVKGVGLGLKLWADLIDRCRKAEYEGTISFCVAGDEMDRMTPGLARFLKLNTQHIFSIQFLVRLLPIAPPAPLAPVSGQDVDLFLELVSTMPQRTPFARIWTREEAEWQCCRRAGAIGVTCRAGSRAGMLTGCLMQAASSPPVSVVLLEDLLWGDLEPPERTRLLDDFLFAAATQGARTASCPLLGYAETNTLEASRFRRSNRLLKTYLTLWGDIQPQPVSSLYIDVL